MLQVGRGRRIAGVLYAELATGCGKYFRRCAAFLVQANERAAAVTTHDPVGPSHRIEVSPWALTVLAFTGRSTPVADLTAATKAGSLLLPRILTMVRCALSPRMTPAVAWPPWLARAARPKWLGGLRRGYELTNY